MKNTYLFIILLLALNSCQFDPHAQLLTTNEPAREDVIGTYVVDRILLPKNLIVGNLNTTVELHADGTFTAINVPPPIDFLPKSDFNSVLIQSTGKWEIGKTGTQDPGARPIWGVYLRDQSIKLLSANFTGEKMPYGLLFQIGDPDSGYAIVLKKQ